MEKAIGFYFDKDMLVKIGSGMHLPLEKTWTCYRGGRIHCGTCPPCATRMRAFAAAGVADVTKYGDGVTVNQKIKNHIKKIIRWSTETEKAG